MDKQFADEMITKFNTIFFGFALTKTANISEAEELASRIVLEAYDTLLKRDNVSNWEGYLYRIASNVYAKYIAERSKYNNLSIDELDLSMDNDFTCNLIKEEDVKTLTREITYLGMIQRKIIVMYYYDNLKIDDIAYKLHLPIGTIKWHLHDARNQLKEGIYVMRSVGNLGIKPITFEEMGHSGSAGMLGDTSYFLRSKLAQNIVYSAYYEAKTIEQIGEELFVSPVYLEDEVLYLEEYGFLNRLKNNRYQANVFIMHSNNDIDKQIMLKLRKAAAEVCDIYIPLLTKYVSKYKEMGIYVPEEDINLLLWSVVPYACGYMLQVIDGEKELYGTNYKVKRKDGGDYIAYAMISSDDKADFDADHYRVCGDMIRGNNGIASWQSNTTYDTRKGGWRDNHTSDYEALYEYMTGTLKKEEKQVERYQRLYEKGMLYQKDGRDTIGMIVIPSKKNEKGYISHRESDFHKNLPTMPDSLKKLCLQIDDEIYQLQKGNYPVHMHKLLKVWNSNQLSNNTSRILIIDELIKRGVLSIPCEYQRKSITTLVFSDVVPNI